MLVMAIAADLAGDAPKWQEDARCAQSDPEAWFPEKGGSDAAAKKICKGCPVKDECLDWALTHDEQHGVWGGLSGPERKQLKQCAA
jgi:WhiB family redox-sensing transcriptional regulator